MYCFSIARLPAVVLALMMVAVSCSGEDSDEADDGSTTAPPPPADPLQIDTDLGPVQGAESEVEGIRAFLAIPYAAPPTDDNRWRPPNEREPWDEALDATSPGAACPQSSEGVTAQIVVNPESEPDCLTLSVWSPEDATGLPVMVWIHGGGLSNGSAHAPLYTGDDLADQDVVVVSMNYRLGALGFLATEELAGERDDGSFGNYGLADQTAALEWVQRNVAGFGGDPDNVTIFGESAGGASVCGHLASPASEGLFHRAIIQSGGGCDRLQPRDEALADGAALLESVGCDDMACMRALPDEDIIAAEFDGGLVEDGVRLSTTARDQAAEGELGDVPVIIGSNADEATLFTLQTEEPTDAGLIELAAEFSDDPDAVVALYPAEDYETNLGRYQAMSTDVRFTCPTLEFASVVPDSFVYHYTFVSEQNPLDLGATHGADVVVLFGHPEGIAIEIERDPAGVALSAEMQEAWAAFATDGDPGEDWRPYSDGGQVTVLDAPIELVDEIRDGRCAELEPLTDVNR